MPRTDFTLWVQALGRQVGFAHFSIAVCGYGIPKLVESGAKHTVKLLGLDELTVPASMNSQAVLRLNANDKLSISEIESYFDPALINDEDCPPTFILSSEPFIISGLEENALEIVTQFADGSV